DVVKYAANVIATIKDAGERVFSVTVPARVGKRVRVHAPNQRELTVTEVDQGDEKRLRLEVELQSAVYDFYAFIVEFEELIPASNAVPARVLWSHLTSVVSEDGSVRHQVRYRVRNFSLQFLGLRLPAGAQVWSVSVANEPRRVHVENGAHLVPLPKQDEADLS